MNKLEPLSPANRSILTEARGERSLRDVAAQVGISHMQLARIESGERGATDETLRKLAKELGLRVKFRTRTVKVQELELMRDSIVR